MKRVGRAQRRRVRREEEVFRPAVHLASHLDSVVHTLVEARENRVLKPSCGLSRERLLVQAPRCRRNDLGDRQIGHEDVIASLEHLVELVAASFGQVELE